MKHFYYYLHRRCYHRLSQLYLLRPTKLNPNFIKPQTTQFHTHHFPVQSIPITPLPKSDPPPIATHAPNPLHNPNHPTFSQADFTTLCNTISNPECGGSDLEAELERTGIEPDSSLVEAVFARFDTSPKLLFEVFKWARKRNVDSVSGSVFDSVINALGKARQFDEAWSLLLERGESGGGSVSIKGFTILIRRYARAGVPQSAIRTYEFACTLDQLRDSVSPLFEILLDSLSKEGHVRDATEYFDRKKKSEPGWAPSVRCYNILLNGWFRSRKLKQAERLWKEMKETNVTPNVVSYGTLVEGYCRMRRVEIAIDLVKEMRTEGIEPNAVVYNPIVDALGEAGRFQEALGMMERFFVLEEGPTISTFNSLVKGYCKAEDLAGASKILKMMISRGIVPTPTTYNYFFRHFSKFGKIEEGMNLYTKMIESGYNPDRLTYQLLMKMLCEDEKLDLAMQVGQEMRARGCDLDLATSTMLVHLLCKMRRLEEAYLEFEEMIRKGIVPQYLTFRRLSDELKKTGMVDKAKKIGTFMSSVHHSTNLPDTYIEDRDASSRARRTSIIQKAETMSDILKTCRNPRELVKRRNVTDDAVASANQLIDDIKKREIAA